MDKQNYTPTIKEIQEIEKKYRKYKAKILREVSKSKVIMRKRIVKSYDILYEAAMRMVLKELSYRRLALEMCLVFHVSMSAVAWKKQLEKFVPVLLNSVNACTDLHTDTSTTYLLDATEIPMEGGKGYGARIHTCYEMNKQTIDQYKISDWHTAETVRNFSEIQAHSLYIGDRAYGKSGQISYLSDHHADFLFRATPHLLSLYEDPDCENKLNFQSVLQGERLDKICYTNFHKNVYQVRVVAVKLPEEMRQAAEKRCRRAAVRKQHKISDKTIFYSRWLILVTSLTLPLDDVTELYRKRWHIEILFKRAKTLFHFHRLHRSCFNYLFLRSAAWMVLLILASFLFFSCSCPSSPFLFFSLFSGFFS